MLYKTKQVRIKVYLIIDLLTREILHFYNLHELSHLSWFPAKTIMLEQVSLSICLRAYSNWSIENLLFKETSNMNIR